MFETTISLFAFYIAGLSLALVVQRLPAFMRGLEKFFVFFGATLGVVCAIAIGSVVLNYVHNFVK